MRYIIILLAFVSISLGEEYQYYFNNGSGAFVNSEYVITAYHVVKKYDNDCYLDVQKEKCYSLTLVDYDEESDIALLKLVKKPARDPFVCSIYDGEVSINTHIVSYGYHNPFASKFKLTSSYGEIKYLHGYTSGYEFYAVNAYVGEGMSGGPVFDTDGYIIGYNHSLYNNIKNIGNITKSTEAMKLIRRNNIEKMPNTDDPSACSVIIISSQKVFNYKEVADLIVAI